MHFAKVTPLQQSTMPSFKRCANFRANVDLAASSTFVSNISRPFFHHAFQLPVRTDCSHCSALILSVSFPNIIHVVKNRTLYDNVSIRAPIDAACQTPRDGHASSSSAPLSPPFKALQLLSLALVRLAGHDNR